MIRDGMDVDAGRRTKMDGYFKESKRASVRACLQALVYSFR